MRHFKALVLTVLAILLTGCYTQLQYSKTTQKSADEQEENVSGYSWTNDDNNGKTVDGNKQKERVKAKQSLENDYTIAYKDYEYDQKWKECGCNPYKVYNFYGSSFDPYGYGYYPYASHQWYLRTSRYYNSWRFGGFYSSRHYYGSRFSIGFTWGYPYHNYFYDPFYGYGYNGFWGHYSHYAYTNFYGSGVYYGSSSQDVNKNNRYGLRSIGTDRVNVNRNRGNNSETVRAQQRSTVTSDGTTVRTRSSVGTSRTRNRGTVGSRGKSGSKNQGTVRNRGNNDNRSSDHIRYRSISDSNLDNAATERQRSRTFRNVVIDNRQNDKQRTFFNRLKGFFKRSAQSLTTGSSSNSTFGSSTRSRFGSSSTTTTRSRSTIESSTSNRSSVGSSQSSSSNSRSRGSSSRSRSGGNDDSGSSSSDRSRDN